MRIAASILASTLALSACGARTATIIDDRETYVETITDTWCVEKDACGEIGTHDGAEYESMEDCEDDVSSFVRDFWPADECGGDQINGDVFLDCDDRARINACDGNVADMIGAWAECNSDEVCID